MKLAILAMLTINQPTIWLEPLNVWTTPESIGVTRIKVDSSTFMASPSSISSALRGAPIPGIQVINSGAEHLLNTLQIRGGAAGGTRVMFDGVELNNPIDPSFDLWLIPSFFIHDATIDLTARKSFWGTLELNPLGLNGKEFRIVSGLSFLPSKNGLAGKPAFELGYAGSGESVTYALWSENSVAPTTIGFTPNNDTITYGAVYHHHAGYLKFKLGGIQHTLMGIKAYRDLLYENPASNFFARGREQWDNLLTYSMKIPDVAQVNLYTKRLDFSMNESQWGYSMTWASTGLGVRTREFRYKFAHLMATASYTRGEIKLRVSEPSYLLEPTTRLKAEIDNGLTLPIGKKAVVSIGAPIVVSGDFPEERNRKFHKILPFASASYDITNTYSIRMAFSHVWHLPNFYDLYLSNQELKPEEGDEIELGFDIRGGRFNATTSAYYRHMYQLIVYVPDTLPDSTVLYRAQNVGEGRFKGVDLYLNYSPGPLTIGIGGSLIDARDKNGVKLPFVANKLSATAKINDFMGIYGALRAEWVARHSVTDFLMMRRYEIPASKWFSFQIGYRLNRRLSLDAEVRNPFNAPMDFKGGYPINARSINLNLRMVL